VAAHAGGRTWIRAALLLLDMQHDGMRISDDRFVAATHPRYGGGTTTVASGPSSTLSILSPRMSTPRLAANLRCHTDAALAIRARDPERSRKPPAPVVRLGLRVVQQHTLTQHQHGATNAQVGQRVVVLVALVRLDVAGA